ncbi:33805_t:CDS:2, partial [Gigaspora margarita]
MSFSQESEYRDVSQDFSDTEDKTKIEGKLGIPVGKICKTEFSKSSSTSTL